MLFKAALDKSSIFIENSIEGPLNVKILAITPGTMLPLRDEAGNVAAQFEATEDLIKGAVSRSRGGLLNVDHADPINSRVGIFSKVVYDGGFLASAQVLCPKWAKIVASGEDSYSGLSVEGSITGNDLEHPESIDIYSISLLSNEKSPQGGACGRDSCKVEIIRDDESDPDSMESQKIEAVWSPNYDAFWSYIETDGKINQSKAKKVFFKKTGDGSNRTDWHYPFAHMTSEGNPEPDSEGLMAAYKRAVQQGETGLFSKIRSKMRSINMEIPEGLKALKEKLEASFDQDTQTFSAKIVDEDNEVLSEKQITIIDNNDSVKGDLEMPKKELKAEIIAEEKVETKIEASTAEIKVEPPEVKIEAEAEMKAALPDIPVMEVPEAKAVAPVAAPGVEPTLDWGLVKNTLGISSVDEFTLIKDAAGKIPSLEEKIDGILKENESLKSFKIETEKKWLESVYPQGVVKDIAAAHAEFTRDPAGFVQKYASEAIKFAASKSVKLQGSAAESELTEETKRDLEVKNAVNYLKRRNGFRV
jgi:hypothetical protein